MLGDSNSAYCLADQHHLNPSFGADWPQLESLVRKMETEWGVLSLCDIVLNHTAKESKWIRKHPEATYNCSNCPHMRCGGGDERPSSSLSFRLHIYIYDALVELRPAFMLDQVMVRLSIDVSEGKWVERGIPKGEISTEEHLQARTRLAESSLSVA